MPKLGKQSLDRLSVSIKDKYQKIQLEEINKLFVYTSDKGLDSWTGLILKDGMLQGDCEDYCIFLKHNISQFKNWDYFYCNLNGVGHCVLIEDNLFIIDCNCQMIMTLDKYKEIYNVSDLKKINLFTVFSKFVFGKLFSLFAIIK